MEDIKQPPQPSQPPVMDIQPPAALPPQQPQPVSSAEQLSQVPVSASENPSPANPAPVAEPPVAPPHKSHRMPMIAILCAVIFTGIFAAVAVLAYRSNSEVKTTDTSQQSTPETPGTAPATATDVTETEKAVDDSMSSVNDTVDYSEDGFSDNSLDL